MPRGRVAPGGNKGGHWRARGRSTRAAPPCGGAFRYRARAESFLCARNSLRGTYQHDADIHHVGIGGARDHQIAERFEVAVGIVFVQVTAGVRIAAEGLPIGDGAGGIGGAVAAIGAGAEDHYVFEAGDVDGGGQDEFLIPSAQALAFQWHGGFSACDDARRRFGGLPRANDFARNGGVHASDLTGLALDLAGEHQRAKSQRPGVPRRRGQGQTISADYRVAHTLKNWVDRLGRFREFAALPAFDAPLHGSRHSRSDSVPVEHFRGRRKGGSIGGRGGGADHVQVVAHYVRKQQRFHRGRRGQTGQLAALDARDVLADGVDLVDIGAAGQQQASSGLLLFERDARSR